MVIAKDDAYHAAVCDTIEGSYSPIVLSRVEGGDRKRVCRTAVYTVYNYYGLELEGDDVEDMVELMCYRVEKSALLITTRESMLHRGLR